MKTTTQRLLIGESFSPWTKKARWALEYCGLAYEYREYTPTLSEPALRWRLRQWTGSVSVPVLLTPHQVLVGSWQIANYANVTSEDQRLGDMEAIAFWNDLSEAALAEGRTRVVRCILSNNQALEESLPGFVPKLLHRRMRFIARDAVQRLDRKYSSLLKRGALRHALTKTRAGLERAGSDFLLERFSYADMTMAVILEVVEPIASTTPPLGPETQSCWNYIELAEEFRDLTQWRDRLAGADSTSSNLPNRVFIVLSAGC